MGLIMTSKTAAAGRVADTKEECNATIYNGMHNLTKAGRLNHPLSVMARTELEKLASCCNS